MVGLNAIAKEDGRTGSDCRPLLSCNAMTDGPVGWGVGNEMTGGSALPSYNGAVDAKLS